MELLNNVSIAGTGIHASTTRQAQFLKSSLSYDPAIDPRLPKYTTLASNLTIASTEIVLGNVALVPSPNVAISSYGAIRVQGEVILYGNLFVANSTITHLTRNVASTVTANATVGNLVSILGLRTVNS